LSTSAAADARGRCLVGGWFSFHGGGATAGDLLTRDLACEWLRSAGYSVDVAVIAPFAPGIDWRAADPARYELVVFVCGPFTRGEFEAEFLAHFSGCRLIGLNLSMLTPIDVWQPFDVLFERDSSERVSPDLAFLSAGALPPVVGVCLVEDYPDALVQEANDAVRRLTASRELTLVPIDTRLEANETGLRTPGEVEALIARMDAVITTRLHGTVLSLKNGVPVLAIDVLGDGRKVLRQCERIGWPVVFAADQLDDAALVDALAYCLSEPGRRAAQASGIRARALAADVRRGFIEAVARS
jgi:glycosyltransferase involved in cell wall biosynthesis